MMLIYSTGAPIYKASFTGHAGIFRLLIKQGASLMECEPLIRYWKKALGMCSRAERFLLGTFDTGSALSYFPHDAAEVILSGLIQLTL